MTDLEALRELFTKRGIGFELEEISPDSDAQIQPARAMVFREGRSSRVIGYTDFMALLYFDASGTLIGVGAWE